MSAVHNQAGLNVKTLINIGVFTALYYVLLAVGGISGILNPVMMFVGPLISILLTGPVIMLFLPKVRTWGAFTIMGFLVGALMVVGGHVWYCIITATLCAAVGDWVARTGHYRNRVRNMVAYAVFSLWTVTPFFPIFYDTEHYFEHI